MSKLENYLRQLKTMQRIMIKFMLKNQTDHNYNKSTQIKLYYLKPYLTYNRSSKSNPWKN